MTPTERVVRLAGLGSMKLSEVLRDEGHLVADAIAEAVAEEREACAEIAEKRDVLDSLCAAQAYEIGEEIRRRDENYEREEK